MMNWRLPPPGWEENLRADGSVLYASQSMNHGLQRRAKILLMLAIIVVVVADCAPVSAQEGDHWSFAPIARPALPPAPAGVRTSNAIDRFVTARLPEMGLTQAPRAERRTLIRRVTFDLTGLPPTDVQVAEFLADDAPGAYERLVDRLLASEHYGEHVARFWLDAARYGDTHGLHVDNYREMWPYRDWVIDAFNDNLPYDQFLVEQLAGDLLPDPSLDQLVATGFSRCHVTTNEGGSIAEEVYVRNVIDRTSTMGVAMMGLTLGCATCHDHKFDPITQRDFYQLFAFFNSLDGPEMDGNTKNPAPFVRVPTPEQAAELDKLQREIATTGGQMQQIVQSHGGTVELTRPIPDVASGRVFCSSFERQDAETQAAFHGNVSQTDGISGDGALLESDGFVEFAEVGDLKQDKPFTLSVWIRPPSPATGPVLAKMELKDLEKGYRITLDEGRLTVLLSGRWPGYAIKLTTFESVVRPNHWNHIAVTYEGRTDVTALALFVDGAGCSSYAVCDSLKEEGSIGVRPPLRLGRVDTDRPWQGLALDEFCIYDRRLREDEVRLLYLRPQAEYLGVADPTSPSLRPILREVSAMVSNSEYQQLAQRRDQLQLERQKLLTAMATTPVFRQRRHRRPAHVLVRGYYDLPGELVAPNTPAALPAMDERWPRNRLGLARWLTSEQHPLTARVAVNRFWQQMFGQGLVATSEDFGVQGLPPSHPELLDWLATEFRESRWNVKSLLKTIALSETYQQDSKLAPELAARDPENRWLSRGPRFRLDAEMLRDQAFAVAGLLDRRIGGPSVKPPQPDGLWQAVSFTGSNTARFRADRGTDKVHRRSLYTFWKRTSPPPQMSIMDAPSREACAMRRERTNTPLQALLLMNDPQYMEAARHFAERILQQGPREVEPRLAWAFQQATVRPAEADELKALRSAYHDFWQIYANDPGAAKAVIEIGEVPPDGEIPPAELASWTMVANTILNLDVVVTKQ